MLFRCFGFWLTGAVVSLMLSLGTMGVDTAVFRWINTHRNPLLDVVLGGVSALGEVSAVWLLACGIVFLLGRRGHREAAAVFVLSVLIVDGLIIGMMKDFWPRPRPYQALSGVNVWGVEWENPSFPSGHAYSSALAAVIFGVKFRRALLPLAIFAGATCYSRPYLGMHYPSDVLVGAAMGVAVGILALQVEKVWKRERGSAKPGWWFEPSLWSLFFALVGVWMLAAAVGDRNSRPLDVLVVGLIAGLAGLWREAGSRKWVGMAGIIIALLGLGAWVAQSLR